VANHRSYGLKKYRVDDYVGSRRVSTILIAGSQSKGMTETNVEKTSRKGNEEKWTGKRRCM